MQVLARALKIRLRAEVRYVDDEGVVLPVPTRIAIPLADARRQMGAPVHHDVALPPLSLTHVVEHRDAAWRLHDPVRALAADPRQPRGQAADRRRAVLRTIMAIDRYRVVAGGALRKSRRGRRIVFAAGTAAVLDPAGLGRSQQGEAKFPIGDGDLLSLRRQLRNPAIGRIHNPGGAHAGMLPGYEKVVVGAGDVELGPALPAVVLSPQRRPLCVQFGSLRLGGKFLGRIPWGGLEGA